MPTESGSELSVAGGKGYIDVQRATCKCLTDYKQQISLLQIVELTKRNVHLEHFIDEVAFETLH